jgi:putative peptidoglycan lipid II flippase
LGQGRPDLFRKELRTILRVIIWLAMPMAAMMFFTRGYIVSIIKVGGDSLIANLFGVFALVILLRSVFHIASRSFYAQQDTKTPMMISLGSIVIAVICAIWFTFGLGMGVYGLAWAQVVWASIEIVALFTVMARRIPKLFDRNFGIVVLKMLLSTGVMSIVTWLMVQLVGIRFDDQNILMVLPQLLAIGIFSVIVYAIMSRLLKLDEVNPIIARIKKIIIPRPKVKKIE